VKRRSNFVKRRFILLMRFLQFILVGCWKGLSQRMLIYFLKKELYI